MKKYTIYIMAILALLVSCSEEEIVKVTPTNGQEVKFSVSMDKVASRTLYGAVADDGKSIKVNWVDGDEITVFGTTCAVQQANYKVSTKGANGVAATDQNYASSLEKTGAVGVQWGTEDNSDFYAIYPAVEGAFSSTNGEVLVTTEIQEKQYATFELKDGTWVGTPYVDNLANCGMENALMYAYTNVNFSKTQGVVDLNFKPFSTVLKFKLAGWTVSDESDLVGELSSTEKVYISKITIYAPDNAYVSGECEFSFKKDENNKMVVTAEGGEYNTITLYPDFLGIGQNETIEFNVFAIPQTYTMESSSPWMVEVETTNFGTHNYSIKPTVAQTLVEGQIHNVAIPKIEVEKQLDLTQYKSEWMKYIPRNVYLSEISVPGAWYATNGDYQTTTDLATQFSKGIRAFNIDCRLAYGAGSGRNAFDESVTNLVCSGTEVVKGISLGFMEIAQLTNSGTTVLSQLKILSDLLNTHKDEYIVVILSIAEKPKNLGNTIYGSVNPEQVLAKLKEVLDDSSLTNLYKEDVTSNTTVNEVLGKMIVKINVNTTADKFTKYTSVPSCVLLSQGSMAGDSEYISGDIVAGSFSSMQTSNIYLGKNTTDLVYYYHHAQRTLSDGTSVSGIPNLSTRMTAVDHIIGQSSSIYKNGLHNAWFQLGIGGYIKDRDNDTEDRATIATFLNSYVLGLVDKKMGLTEGSVPDPSPVGIVLMNYCTNNTYKSEDLINAIITMNTKFYLNRDDTQVDWPEGSPFGNGGVQQ